MPLTANLIPKWTPLTQEGTRGVSVQVLLTNDHLHLAMLSLLPNATIHEHAADHHIDVICLEGSGYTSIGSQHLTLRAGEKIHWPAGHPHRLWTGFDQMKTLMVEHTREQ